MKKRMISLLLAIVMVLGLIPAMAMTANAAPATVIIVDGQIYRDGESSDSGHVQFQNGVLTITGKGSPVIFDDNSAMPATIKNIDDGDLTIKFEDDVEIIAPAGGKGILVAGNLTMIIAEGKTVTISADYECIEAQGIEIMGNGTLILKSESSECIDSVTGYRASYLTIQNTVVKAETNGGKGHSDPEKRISGMH